MIEPLAMAHRARLLVLVFALLVCGALPCFTPSSTAVVGDIPAKLSDKVFWSMVSEYSEPGGFFRSDNLVSNESSFQHVIPVLEHDIGTASAYIGVGPDQNFTYIVALKPKIAFIVDIRRQNLLLHLMYKAVIELSPGRADFLSRLFSRKRPAGLSAASSVDELFRAFDEALPDTRAFSRNLRDVLKQLVDKHGFLLSAEDARTIEYVYRAFFTAGPDLRYSFPNGFGWSRFPSYRELMTETDGAGATRSYLASEANYAVLRSFEARNLVVPVVGDFAGSRALRSVGTFLREHGATVSAFYTSNVEQYLFRGEDWQRFYTNVGAMPLDGRSTFVRAYFDRFGFRYSQPGSGLPSETLVCPIATVVSAFTAGRLQSYEDVIGLSK